MANPTRIKRVLAIGAHPDDCELLCGGTLASFAASGAEVGTCSMTRGDKGSRMFTPEELSRIRRAEAVAAASKIGARYECLDASDGEILDDPNIRRRLLEAIRRFRPDLILTHWPADYHADHRVTGELVTECSWFAASPGHITESDSLPNPIPVSYMDTLAGLDFEPTEYVDISRYWLKKEEMLSSHASQLTDSAQHGQRDLIALARDVARFRGQQCGVEFAEAFRPCLKWKRVRPYRMLPE